MRELKRSFKECNMIRRRSINRRENRVLRRESYNDELTVGRLRYILERALDQIDGYDDKDIVSTVSNTYPLKGASSYMLADNIGFLNLNDIEVEEAWDDDDEDDDED